MTNMCAFLFIIILCSTIIISIFSNTFFYPSICCIVCLLLLLCPHCVIFNSHANKAELRESERERVFSADTETVVSFWPK